jgi:hypothetical protein
MSGWPYTGAPSRRDQATLSRPAAGKPVSVPVLAPFPWYWGQSADGAPIRAGDIGNDATPPAGVEPEQAAIASEKSARSRIRTRSVCTGRLRAG